jgi:hypothetical protein
MNIIFENYKLEPEDTRFNLYKTETRKDKDGNPKEVTDILGYAMPFENCLKCIAHDKLSENNQDLSIQEFIKQYKEISNTLLNSLKS